MAQGSIAQVRESLAPDSEGAFTPGGPLVYGALGICPLHRQGGSGVDYLTYDEALEKGTVTVSEVSENGSVPELRLTNKGSEKVLIIDGEQLVGAKQNRILNTTVLVEAESSIVIPVSCVEEGRWHYEETKTMRASRAPLYAMTRAMKSRQVNESLRRRRAYSSDQHAIWFDISNRLASECVASPSQAMDDHFRSNMERLDEYSENLGLERFEGYADRTIVGAVFTLSGKIMGMDAFDRAETLEKQWPKLLNSYAIEAVRSKGKGGVDLEKVGRFLRLASEADMEVFDPPGLGDDVRITGETVVGGCLVHDGALIHIYAFNTDGDKERENSASPGHTARMAGYRERARRRSQDEGPYLI